MYNDNKVPNLLHPKGKKPKSLITLYIKISDIKNFRTGKMGLN